MAALSSLVVVLLARGEQERPPSAPPRSPAAPTRPGRARWPATSGRPRAGWPGDPPDRPMKLSVEELQRVLIDHLALERPDPGAGTVGAELGAELLVVLLGHTEQVGDHASARTAWRTRRGTRTDRSPGIRRAGRRPASHMKSSFSLRPGAGSAAVSRERALGVAGGSMVTICLEHRQQVAVRLPLFGDVVALRG